MQDAGQHRAVTLLEVPCHEDQERVGDGEQYTMTVLPLY